MFYFLYFHIMNMQQLLLLGRATKDAELLESKEGKKFGKMSIAVNDYSKGKEKSTPSYYSVLVFNKTIDNLTKVLKGDLVMIDGKPSIDAYINNDGEAKANIVVLANKWKVIK